MLFNLIRERRSTFKKPGLDKWAKAVDLMIRKDGREAAEIEQVIRWSQKDEFWQDNILSTAKLRKQFDQLAMKMAKTLNREPELPAENVAGWRYQ